MTDTPGYANRVAEGLRHDGYPNKLNWLDAAIAGARYSVEVPREATTIKDLSLVIAEGVLGGGR